MDEQRGEQESTASGPEAGERASERTAAPASERTDDRQLAPEARRSPRWLASLRKAKLPLLAALVLTLGGGLAVLRFLRASEPSCKEIWDRDLGYDRAVIACQREYDRTKDPRIGAILADSLRRADNVEAAKLVAHELLETKARPDALLTLAKVAFKERKANEARPLFAQAEKLYTAAGDWRQAAKTVLAWAQLTNDEQRYVEALEQLDRCAHLARQAGSSAIEAACYSGASRIFSSMGAEELAWSQLNRARKLDGERYEETAIGLNANYLQESSGQQHRQATARFESAVAEVARLQNKQLAAGLHLNLAFSLAAVDKLDEAADQLERAKVAGSEKSLPGNSRSVAGYLEMKRKNFVAADALLAEAIAIFSEKGEWNDVVEASNDRADMALGAGNFAEAAAHARQSTNAVERMLTKQSLLHYRSWLTAHYRRAYELLFLALAKQGKAEQALAVVDQWMSRGAIESLLPRPPQTEELADAVAATKTLASIHQSLARSELANPLAFDELRSRLAAEDVVIIVIAEDELWRLSLYDAIATVSLLGKYSVLSRELFDGFKREPFNLESANAVGNLVLPPDLRDDSEVRHQPLHVVLDERLTTLPVEALRINGKLLLEQRPIVRGLRPSQIGCAPPIPPSPKVTILADSIGDLPGGLRAANAVAKQFGVSAFTGTAATRAHLAVPSDLLHVAVHGSVDESGFGVLGLADGNESGVDIAMRGSSPAIVFLAACKSALSEHGSYSLAAAFLAAGSNQVIATLHSVDNELAARVTTEFYANGGSRDPATALAKTLATIAAAHARDPQIAWPRFAVFGRATCKVSDTARGD